MLLIVLLGGIGQTRGVVRGQHVPEAVCAEYEASVACDIYGDDAHVRLRGHDELVICGVVAPEVTYENEQLIISPKGYEIH